MTTNPLRHRLISLPIVQAMNHRRDFQTATTVETSLPILEIGTSYADSGQLAARWDRAIRVADERILWRFESDEDAILFMCRFDGVSRGTIAMPDWQRENYI